MSRSRSGLQIVHGGSVPGEVPASQRHANITELLDLFSDRGLIGDTQKAILQLVTCGYTDESVAKKLDVTARTVQRHVAKTMALFGARSRLELGIMLADRSARLADSPTGPVCTLCRSQGGGRTTGHPRSNARMDRPTGA